MNRRRFFLAVAALPIVAKARPKLPAAPLGVMVDRDGKVTPLKFAPTYKTVNFRRHYQQLESYWWGTPAAPSAEDAPWGIDLYRTASRRSTP